MSHNGTGVVGLLQIAFIVLKLCHVISWSWWIVLLPAEIGVSVTLLILGSIAIYTIITLWRAR
jgi:hypothetical protein